MSIVVPGVSGTTSVIWRAGNGSAAWPGRIAVKTAPTASNPNEIKRPSGMSEVRLDQSNGADRRGFRVDQGEPVFANPVEILQIRHRDHAVFAQGARIVKYARRLGFIVAVIEIVADDDDAPLDAPHRGADGQIGRRFHPFFRTAVVSIVEVGAQYQSLATPEVAGALLQIVGGNRLAGHFVAKVGNDCVADEQIQRQLMNLP